MDVKAIKRLEAKDQNSWYRIIFNQNAMYMNSTIQYKKVTL
jgi:hypothetical protein